MKRKPNWELALSEYMLEARHKTWPDFSCGHFAAGAVEAMTGVNPDLPGYKSRRGVVRALKKTGAKSLDAHFRRHFGDPVPVSYARKGDVVEFDGPEGVCFGVVFTRNKAVFITDGGLSPVSVLQCAKAWAIPLG